MRTALRPRTGWLLLAAALAVVSVGGISHDHKRFLRSPEGKATFALTPPRLLEELRIDLVDDGDALRYRAYVDAALGRPHQAYYVRTASQWLASFRAGERVDPDDSPATAPGRPLLPYRDYLVEYPPGFFLAAVPPALVARSASGYVDLFCLLMAACLAGAVLICARLSPVASAPARPSALPWWCGLGVLALGTVSTHRYDAAVAIVICAMVAAALEGKPALAGAALGLAIGMKLTPLLLAPLVLAACSGGGRRALSRVAGAAALVSLAIWLPPLWLAGQGLAEMLRYHMERPVQIESTAGALLGIARALVPGSVWMTTEFGSHNFAGPLAARASAATGILGVAVPLAAIAHATRRILRSPSREEEAAALAEGVVVVLIALMAFAKVFSPQYLVWVLPLGMLAALRRSRGAAVLFLAVLALTQVVFPFSYGGASRGEPWPYPIILCRNLLLIGFGVWCLRSAGAPQCKSAKPA